MNGAPVATRPALAAPTRIHFFHTGLLAHDTPSADYVRPGADLKAKARRAPWSGAS